MTTRSEDSRGAIEAAGAECWVGNPDRLATLRGAMENVTILCWLLGTAVGSESELQQLHTSRLEFFLTQAIDTTVRGLIYEGRGTASSAELLRGGEVIARTLTARNAIPVAFLTADPGEPDAWLEQASAAVASLLISA